MKRISILRLKRIWSGASRGGSVSLSMKRISILRLKHASGAHVATSDDRAINEKNLNSEIETRRFDSVPRHEERFTINEKNLNSEIETDDKMA